MNFTVTGDPAPSQLDQKRKTLLQSMLSGGPGATRLLGGPRGLSRGYSANDSPNAAVPGLTFNPFLAQLQRGVGGLQGPSQQARQVVNDLTGAPGAAPSFAGSGGQAGTQAPTPGNGPVQDSGPSGSAGPTDLAGLYAGAGIDPSQVGGLGWSPFLQPGPAFPSVASLNGGPQAQRPPGGDVGRWIQYDPQQQSAPPVAPPISFLRPGGKYIG